MKFVEIQLEIIYQLLAVTLMGDALARYLYIVALLQFYLCRIFLIHCLFQWCFYYR